MGWADDPRTDWVEVTAWAAIAYAVMTFVLVVIAVVAARYARKTVQTQTATYFSRRWDEDDMLDTRAALSVYDDSAALKAAFFDLYDGDAKQNREALVMLRQANYLEDLAILLQQKAVSDDFVARSLGYIMVSRWELWKDVADEFMDRAKGTDNFPAFRAMAQSLKGDPRLA